MVSDLFLFDTNVLIYVLNGDRRAASLSISSPSLLTGAISMITWMEVMVGASPPHEQKTSLFLSRFQIVEINKAIAERAVTVRRQMRIKLPDAIVYATALSVGRTLVTFNTRDFPAGTASVHHPDSGV